MSTDSTPYGYCKCGCGRKTSIAKRTHARYRHVKGEPTHYIQGHRNKKWYIVNEETGCWEWQGYKNALGYGHVRMDNQRLYAHVLMYKTMVGEIPSGMYMDHLCRNPSCVNPDHLEPVTPELNVQRGLAAKLNPELVLEMRTLAMSGELHEEIAKRFGISQNATSCAISGKTWRNVGNPVPPRRGVGSRSRN